MGSTGAEGEIDERAAADGVHGRRAPGREQQELVVASVLGEVPLRLLDCDRAAHEGSGLTVDGSHPGLDGRCHLLERRVRPTHLVVVTVTERLTDHGPCGGAEVAARLEEHEVHRPLVDVLALAVALRRRIIFSHPALDFERLLVSKRPPPVLSAPGDNYFGMHNGTGPGLVILDDWKSDRPKETVLLEGKLPPGCAMHADVSFDGRRIVIFSGGAKAEDDRVFEEVRAIRDGGGFGSIIGRNSFQRPRAEALKFLDTVIKIYGGELK